MVWPSFGIRLLQDLLCNQLFALLPMHSSRDRFIGVNSQLGAMVLGSDSTINDLGYSVSRTFNHIQFRIRRGALRAIFVLTIRARSQAFTDRPALRVLEQHGLLT